MKGLNTGSWWKILYFSHKTSWHPPAFVVHYSQKGWVQCFKKSDRSDVTPPDKGMRNMHQIFSWCKRFQAMKSMPAVVSKRTASQRSARTTSEPHALPQKKHLSKRKGTFQQTMPHVWGSTEALGAKWNWLCNSVPETAKEQKTWSRESVEREVNNWC